MATASGQVGARWWEEIRPQISIIALFFVFLLALSLQNRVVDPDLWWHLRTGQWILEEGRIPYADPFSFTAEGQPWIAHSWLAEIVMYLLYRSVGPLSLFLLRSLLQVATMGLLLRMMWQRWPRLGGDLLLLLVVLFATARFWLARPNSVSLAACILVVYLWYRYKWHGRDSLWLLPPLLALWANLHAGYIFGLFLLGTLFAGEALAGRVWSDPKPLERSRWLRFGFFSLLSFLAVLANPYHVRLLYYPFSYYVGQISLLPHYIGDWLSPDFHQPADILFALLILALIAALAWRRSNMGPAETVTLLVFLGLSLMSVRAAGIAIPLLALSLAGVLGQGGTAARTAPARRGAWPRPRQSTVWAWYGGTLLLVVALLTATMIDFASWGRADGFLEQGYPRDAVDALSNLPASARMFNTYDWGGYLIWRLYPDRLVFIDPRADLYGNAFFTEFLEVWRAAPEWSAVLDRYTVEVVLCERQGPLATVLTTSSLWQAVHLDPVAAVFRRSP